MNGDALSIKLSALIERETKRFFIEESKVLFSSEEEQQKSPWVEQEILEFIENAQVLNYIKSLQPEELLAKIKQKVDEDLVLLNGEDEVQDVEVDTNDIDKDNGKEDVQGKKKSSFGFKSMLGHITKSRPKPKRTQAKQIVDENKHDDDRNLVKSDKQDEYRNNFAKSLDEPKEELTDQIKQTLVQEQPNDEQTISVKKYVPTNAMSAIAMAMKAHLSNSQDGLDKVETEKAHFANLSKPQTKEDENGQILTLAAAIPSEIDLKASNDVKISPLKLDSKRSNYEFDLQPADDVQLSSPVAKKSSPEQADGESIFSSGNEASLNGNIISPQVLAKPSVIRESKVEEPIEGGNAKIPMTIQLSKPRIVAPKPGIILTSSQPPSPTKSLTPFSTSGDVSSTKSTGEEGITKEDELLSRTPVASPLAKSPNMNAKPLTTASTSTLPKVPTTTKFGNDLGMTKEEIARQELADRSQKPTKQYQPVKLVPTTPNSLTFKKKENSTSGDDKALEKVFFLINQESSSMVIAKSRER